MKIKWLTVQHGYKVQILYHRRYADGSLNYKKYNNKCSTPFAIREI